MLPGLLTPNENATPDRKKNRQSADHRRACRADPSNRVDREEVARPKHATRHGCDRRFTSDIRTQVIRENTQRCHDVVDRSDREYVFSLSHLHPFDNERKCRGKNYV